MALERLECRTCYSWTVRRRLMTLTQYACRQARRSGRQNRLRAFRALYLLRHRPALQLIILKLDLFKKKSIPALYNLNAVVLSLDYGYSICKAGGITGYIAALQSAKGANVEPRIPKELGRTHHELYCKVC